MPHGIRRREGCLRNGLRHSTRYWGMLAVSFLLAFGYELSIAPPSSLFLPSARMWLALLVPPPCIAAGTSPAYPSAGNPTSTYQTFLQRVFVASRLGPAMAGACDRNAIEMRKTVQRELAPDGYYCDSGLQQKSVRERRS